VPRVDPRYYSEDMWILIAFLNPILHAFSNVLDNYLTNRLFSRKTTIIFYAALLNLAFLPFLFIFTGLPGLPTSASIWLFMGLAVINVIYQYPYYKALEQNDTSNVIALFSLGQLFVPVLAYFVVGEVLSTLQYVGVAIILLASVGLSAERLTRFRMNASLWWMLLCTSILSFEYVLYKLLFAHVDWITGFTWPVVFSFAIAFLLLLLPATRADIVRKWGTFKTKLHVFAMEELTTFLGIAAGTYAVSVAPVTVVKAIMATEPAFVLLYAMLFGRTFPRVFKEETDRITVFRKLLLFAVIGIGLILALEPEWF